jgi:hypothetical protein
MNRWRDLEKLDGAFFTDKKELLDWTGLKHAWRLKYDKEHVEYIIYKLEDIAFLTIKRHDPFVRGDCYLPFLLDPKATIIKDNELAIKERNEFPCRFDIRKLCVWADVVKNRWHFLNIAMYYMNRFFTHVVFKKVPIVIEESWDSNQKRDINYLHESALITSMAANYLEFVDWLYCANCATDLESDAFLDDHAEDEEERVQGAPEDEEEESEESEESLEDNRPSKRKNPKKRAAPEPARKKVVAIDIPGDEEERLAEEAKQKEVEEKEATREAAAKKKKKRTRMKPRVRTKLMTPAEVWLKFPEHNKKRDVVLEPMPEPERMDYEPTYRPYKDLHECFNTWCGYEITRKVCAQWIKENLEPNKERYDKAREILEIYHEHNRQQLCAGDELLFNFTMDWCASVIQRPWVKLLSTPVLIGPVGIGKNTLFNLLRYAIGSVHSFEQQGAKRIANNFNAVFNNKLFMVGDEVMVNDPESQNFLKTLVTGDTLIVELKNVDAIIVTNRVNFCLISNKEYALILDKDERRYWILPCSGTNKTDVYHHMREKAKIWFPEKCVDDYTSSITVRKLYWSKIIGHLHSLNMQAGTYTLEDTGYLFIQYLYERDISNFEPTQLPSSAASAQLQLASSTPITQWWHTCVERGYHITGWDQENQEWIKEWENQVDEKELYNLFLSEAKDVIMQKNIRSTVFMFWKEMKLLLGPKSRLITYDAASKRGRGRGRGAPQPKNYNGTPKTNPRRTIPDLEECKKMLARTVNGLTFYTGDEHNALNNLAQQKDGPAPAGRGRGRKPLYTGDDQYQSPPGIPDSQLSPHSRWEKHRYDYDPSDDVYDVDQ